MEIQVMVIIIALLPILFLEVAIIFTLLPTPRQLLPKIIIIILPVITVIHFHLLLIYCNQIKSPAFKVNYAFPSSLSPLIETPPLNANCVSPPSKRIC